VATTAPCQSRAGEAQRHDVQAVRDVLRRELEREPLQVAEDVDVESRRAPHRLRLVGPERGRHRQGREEQAGERRPVRHRA